MYKTRIDNVIW